MKSRRRKFLHETVELNITAFLNLMVILVPFLLITAVFSRMTVLELTLPPLNATAKKSEQIDLELQLFVYPNSLEIRDANIGRLRQVKIENGIVDWLPVKKALLELKTLYPQETSITLFLDKAVPYSRLIEVMDHVRSTEIVNVTTLQEVELFPDVSIGMATEQKTEQEENVSLEALEGALHNSSRIEVGNAQEGNAEGGIDDSLENTNDASAETTDVQESSNEE